MGLNKQTILSIVGFLLFIAFIVLTIFYQWFGLLWLILWITTALMYANAHGKNEQLQIVNSKIIAELQRTTNATSIAQTHNDILLSIIEKMEDGKEVKEAMADIIRETTNNKGEDNNEKQQTILER